MLTKIDKLKPWQVFIIIAVIGIAVFSAGLSGQFQGDDSLQIVNNPVVHSISNIGKFFSGSTFYSSIGGNSLKGTGYYRPMMTTLYAIVYTIFGPNPTAFHILQLAIYICTAYLVFLILRYYFKTTLALLLSLVFLVHPLNSQIVYSIPCLQDALYMFFGLLAIWTLLTYDSIKSLLFVALCLFLSMLSKEAGFIFVVMVIVYLLMFFREQLLRFLGVIVIPTLIYLVMRQDALSSGSPLLAAPIDTLKLSGRIMTMPSIVQFYLTKFIFPWKLSTDWYWVYPHFSIAHVLIPLIIDLGVIGGFIYIGHLVRKKARKDFNMYTFFGIWALTGLIPYLQFFPLDMTACETWFCFSMVGILGMIGIILKTFPPRISPTKLLLIAAILLTILGVRSFVRGRDYSTQETLSLSDISASSQDYYAYSQLAAYSEIGGLSNLAVTYANLSINAFPNTASYNTLGLAYFELNDYPGAYKAFEDSLKIDPTYTLALENLGLSALVYGNTKANQQYLSWVLAELPHDSDLWEYQAIFDREQGDINGARIAINKAAKFGQIQQTVYDIISTNKPTTFPFENAEIKLR